jgi:hypothetical protein
VICGDARRPRGVRNCPVFHDHSTSLTAARLLGTIHFHYQRTVHAVIVRLPHHRWSASLTLAALHNIRCPSTAYTLSLPVVCVLCLANFPWTWLGRTSHPLPVTAVLRISSRFVLARLETCLSESVQFYRQTHPLAPHLSRSSCGGFEKKRASKEVAVKAEEAERERVLSKH